ncbi:MAG: N-acetylneuraminate synthase family protein [Myxococcales bacterium]|nr:N-acetylneuraminate synthase family protein [Myxococcales bacterium]
MGTRNSEMFLSEGRCRVIAEVGQSHDGSLGTAHAFIDAIADSGADAVKFQTHIAAAESSPDEPWRVKFSPQDTTRFDYWKRMEFTADQWRGLKEHADQRDLFFLSSPFSEEAVDLLADVEVAAWKVASGQITDLWMLERLAKTGWPVLFSTGMSPLEEVEWAVAWAQAKGLEVAVMQCTSAYPSSFNTVGLNVMTAFRDDLQVPVGLSDHTGTIYPSLAAAVLGARLVEVHVTFSRKAFGPDVPASVTFDELALLVDGVRAAETMLANPVDKNAVAGEMGQMRELFTKSIAARRDLEAGATLRVEDLTTKKPARGISARRMHDVVGKRLTRAVMAGSFLREADIEV